MAVIYSKMGGPAGANLLVNPRRLSDGLGVNAVDMRRGSGDLRPIREPVPVIADTPAVSSLLTGDMVVEGNTLVFVCTLSWPAVLPAIYSISWGGGSASSSDYTSPPTLTNGVTFITGNTQILVPVGVQTFQIRFGTVDDAAVESTEELPLTIGGVTALGSILDNDGTSGFYCPLDNYREISPDGTPGFTYANINPTGASLLVGRTDNPLFCPPYWFPPGPGPTKHGKAWALREPTYPYRSIDVEITATDPSATKSNTVYFELLGGTIVYIYDQTNTLVSSQTIDQSAYIVWVYHSFTVPGFIKRVVFKYNPIAGGEAFITNVKLLCSQPPAYCPIDSVAIADPLLISPGLTVVETSTIGDTAYAVDYDGSFISAYHYPGTQNGAIDYGPTWVVGNPLDAVKTLTVTVDDPTAKKLDMFSFEADGCLRIEVWDQFTSLTGPPTYQFDRVYNVPSTFNHWWGYTCYPLVHPPIGTHGNIKRVRFTARNPASDSAFSGTTTGVKPTQIYNLQFGCANVVSQRTDVNVMSPDAPA